MIDSFKQGVRIYLHMEIPKIQILDWISAYKKYLVGELREVPWAKTSFDDLENALKSADSSQSKLLKNDGFVPAQIDQLLPEDLGNLLNLESRIYQEEFDGLPYLAYYRNIVSKIATVVAERNADFFADQMSADKQRSLFSWKMSFPTEQDLFSNVLPYVLNEMPSPHMYTGEDFSALVARLCEDKKLAAKISQIFAEYVAEYLKRKKKVT